MRNQATSFVMGPPRPVNISAFAGKMTFRVIRAGITKVSAAPMWFPARMTGPEDGMFSSPTARAP